VDKGWLVGLHPRIEPSHAALVPNEPTPEASLPLRPGPAGWSPWPPTLPACGPTFSSKTVQPGVRKRASSTHWCHISLSASQEQYFISTLPLSLHRDISVILTPAAMPFDGGASFFRFVPQQAAILLVGPFVCSAFREAGGYIFSPWLCVSAVQHDYEGNTAPDVLPCTTCWHCCHL